MGRGGGGELERYGVWSVRGKGDVRGDAEGGSEGGLSFLTPLESEDRGEES